MEGVPQQLWALTAAPLCATLLCLCRSPSLLWEQRRGWGAAARSGRVSHKARLGLVCSPQRWGGAGPSPGGRAAVGLPLPSWWDGRGWRCCLPAEMLL